jgi:hypothetical protein
MSTLQQYLKAMNATASVKKLKRAPPPIIALQQKEVRKFNIKNFGPSPCRGPSVRRDDPRAFLASDTRPALAQPDRH